MFDIRKSYEVNYSSSSRRLHGLDLLYPPYMVNDGDRSDIHIEPIYSDDCIAGVADILTNLILVIDAGVIILGDESLLEEGRVLLREFYSIKQKIHDKISVDL